MNIPPMLLRDPEFLMLRRKIGDSSLFALTAIGLQMQSRKTNKLPIPTKEHLVMFCDVDVDPEILWSALVPQWLTPLGNDEYGFPLFDRSNAQLLNNWANGAKVKAKKELNSSSTQSNPTQLNTNSTQLNSDATSMPRQCHGSATNGVRHPRW